MVELTVTLTDLLYALSFIGGVFFWLALEKYVIRKIYERIGDPNEPIRRDARINTPCRPPITSGESFRRCMESQNQQEKKINIKPKKEKIRHHFTGLPWE